MRQLFQISQATQSHGHVSKNRSVSKSTSLCKTFLLESDYSGRCIMMTTMQNNTFRVSALANALPMRATCSRLCKDRKIEHDQIHWRLTTSTDFIPIYISKMSFQSANRTTSQSRMSCFPKVISCWVCKGALKCFRSALSNCAVDCTLGTKSRRRATADICLKRGSSQSSADQNYKKTLTLI